MHVHFVLPRENIAFIYCRATLQSLSQIYSKTDAHASLGATQFIVTTRKMESFSFVFLLGLNLRKS